MAFKFEKLEVWKIALDLSDKIDKLTIENFPKHEIYILTSQIKRAADSVALNIAEGSTGQSDKEFNRFLGFALRSGIEVVSCLYIARNRGYIDQEKFKTLYDQYENLTIKIQALRRSLR